MNKLDELERMADAALAVKNPFPYMPEISRFQTAANPATIKELVQLVKQCKEALENSRIFYDFHGNPMQDCDDQVIKALAQIEKWENGK